MSYNSDVFERIRRAWLAVEGRLAAYRLVLPGSPTFHCQPNLCDAHCCRSFTVNLDESEVRRLAKESGLRPIEFLEREGSVPLALPLAQPFILARRGNGCALLGANLGCSQYNGRPNACRLYPHFILVYDWDEERLVHADVPGINESFERLMKGEPPEVLVPMLVRHIECPGFTGAPMDDDAWRSLFRETYALQYRR